MSERTKDRNAIDRDRARAILANNPAALVTVQADGTLIIVTQQGRIEITGDLKWRVE